MILICPLPQARGIDFRIIFITCYSHSQPLQMVVRAQKRLSVPNESFHTLTPIECALGLRYDMCKKG